MTFDDFRTATLAAYQTAGEPSDAQIYRAIADYAHSLFVRQVESDLPLAKSFADTYAVLKLRLAGSRATAGLDVVKAAVRLLLPVDADTDGAQDLLDNAIEQARDDFNGTADRFEVELINAAMDLQRHVPFYQGRNETTYTYQTAGLSNQGFVSQLSLPDDFRIQQVWAGRFHTALVEGVAFAAGDVVESNGRAYKVTVGGTLTDGQLGDGLTSQDRTVDETLGDLTFNYHCDIRSVPVRELQWGNREILFSGRYGGGPVYCISPQFDKLWLYPPLIDSRQFFMLEWVGVKTSYEDDDDVTFDRLAAQAAAQYIRAMLAKDVDGDGRASAAALALYQALVRKCVIDNQARETGTTSTTSDLLAINLGRVPWWRWSTLSCTTTSTQDSTPSNSEYEEDNSSGDVQITGQSPNHQAKINVSGSAGERAVALNFNTQSTQGGTFLAVKGSRIVVSLSLELVAGIILNFVQDITTGDPIVDYSGNPVIIESDGVSTGAVAEFYFDGDQWVFLRAVMPA